MPARIGIGGEPPTPIRLRNLSSCSTSNTGCASAKLAPASTLYSKRRTSSSRLALQGLPGHQSGKLSAWPTDYPRRPARDSDYSEYLPARWSPHPDRLPQQDLDKLKSPHPWLP